MGTNSRTETRRLLTETEAAEYLGTTPGTLKQDRHVPGFAIPFVRLSRKAIRYDIRELDRVISERSVRPEPVEATAGGASDLPPDNCWQGGAR
jgi:hypothetical protein